MKLKKLVNYKERNDYKELTNHIKKKHSPCQNNVNL